MNSTTGALKFPVGQTVLHKGNPAVIVYLSMTGGVMTASLLWPNGDTIHVGVEELELY